ncbi:hypothetical protein U0070_026149 [Myodes glareolus]|uniref:Uncharacterized protein n=1 Tax=Myodes glareolus TaxID=447135 RepID=A0AAW0I015_MYOGA
MGSRFSDSGWHAAVVRNQRLLPFKPRFSHNEDGAGVSGSELSWPMESQADTPSSQSVESCSLDLPAACDFRGREAAPEASQGTSSKSLSSLESHSFPCSSTADPGNKKSLNRTNFSNNWQRHRHVVVLFLHLEGVSFLSHVERHFTQQHCGEGLQRNLPE